MIGFKGQTPATIRRDIEILRTKFKYGIINLFTENRLNQGLMDTEIKDWFRDEFSGLADEPNIDILWNNTDLGVG
jgi:hypothetical protein